MQRLAMALALGLAFHSSPAGAQSAGDSACTFDRRIGYRTTTLPAQLCDGDRTSLVVHACAECDHVIAGWFDGAIHLRFLSRAICPRMMCQAESLVVPLGRLAAGTHRFLIDASARVLIDPVDSTFCEVSQKDTLTLEVGTCTPPPPPPTGALPFVTEVRIGTPLPCIECPSVICPGDSFPVLVAGTFPAPCYELLGIELLPSPLWSPRPVPPIVRLRVAVPGTLGDPCLGPPTPFRGVVKLPGLPSGPYSLIVQEAWLPWYDLERPDTVFTATFPFEVAAQCSSGGPPPRVPLVATIEVGDPPCLACRVETCPRDSIPVRIAGVFPDDCWAFRGVEVLPSDAGSIVPQPPKLRVDLFRNDCLDRLCAAVAVSFETRLKLPPLLAGPYTLEVEERQTVFCGVPPDTSFRHGTGFKVSERCSTSAPGCFFTDWVRGSGTCDTIVDRGQPGHVTLTALSNTVPMAGLQGALTFTAAGYHITDLAPVGPATTWQMAWQPTPNGARFVMFSTDGTLIPETEPVFPPHPVLRATVAVAGDLLPAPVTTLVAGELRASDASGLDVPECSFMTLELRVGARICFGGASCDVNLDLSVDVRDLVVMVHCVDGTGPCPDGGSLDCDANGQSTLDDVVCCAQAVLHGGLPGSTVGRPEPGVRVDFGAPVATPSGLEVPLRIEGVDRLGAARLALRFPSDRFEIGGVEKPVGAGEWIDLHTVDGDALKVGLIRVGPQEIARGSLPLALRLVLKPGQVAGGELRLESGDFSGPDGAALAVDFTPTALPIGGDARLLLSAPQPSPFQRETRFAISLPHAEQLELSVHDLAGRRVATLFRQPLEGGTRVFRWTGTDEGGAPVRDGIYFVHARVAGGEVTRKVILLRGD